MNFTTTVSVFLFGVWLSSLLISCKIFNHAKVLSCGRRQGFGASVIGGEKAKKNEWPWLVGFVKVPEEKFFCGGSLVTEKHIVSASHCFESKGIAVPVEPEYIHALIGRFNLSNSNEKGSKVALVWDIILHPDWKYEGEKYDADIAIVVLTQRVNLSNQIQLVCLPAAYHEPLGLGVVVGWGKSNVNVEHVDTPNKLELPVVNASYCYTRFPKLSIASSHRGFCAGFENKGRGSCTGDSGGGFYMKDPNGHFWSIKGIVSGSLFDEKFGCDVNSFGLYTNVAYFRIWIDEETNRTSDAVLKTVEVQCENIEGIGNSNFHCSHYFKNDADRNIKVYLQFPKNVSVETISFSLSLKRTPSIHISAPHLREFSLSNGNIEFINRATFRNMKNLGKLSIWRQKMRILPYDVFDDLKNLTDLILGANKIEKLPTNIFSKAVNLKSLYLSSNKLYSLPKDLFANNLQLESIWVADNNIIMIEVDFTLLPSIQLINLRGNACFDSFYSHRFAAILDFQLKVNRYCTRKP